MPLSRTGERPPDGGEYFTVEPNRDQLRSIARRADADELRRPSVEIFPLASAREAFRAQPGAGPARQGGVGRHMSGVLARIAGSAIPHSALAVHARLRGVQWLSHPAERRRAADRRPRARPRGWRVASKATLAICARVP